MSLPRPEDLQNEVGANITENYEKEFSKLNEELQIVGEHLKLYKDRVNECEDERIAKLNERINLEKTVAELNTKRLTPKRRSEINRINSAIEKLNNSIEELRKKKIKFSREWRNTFVKQQTLSNDVSFKNFQLERIKKNTPRRINRIRKEPVPSAMEFLDDLKELSVESESQDLARPEFQDNLVRLFRDCQLQRVSLMNAELYGQQLEPLLLALRRKPLAYLNLSGNNLQQDGSRSKHHEGMRALGKLVNSKYQRQNKLQLELVLHGTHIDFPAMQAFCEQLKAKKTGIFPRLDLCGASLEPDAITELLKTAQLLEDNNKYFSVEFPKETVVEAHLELLSTLVFENFYYVFDSHVKFNDTSIRHLITHIAKFKGKSYAVYGYSAISISSANLDFFIDAIEKLAVMEKPPILMFGFSFGELNLEQTYRLLQEIKRAKNIIFPGLNHLAIDQRNFDSVCAIFSRKTLRAVSVGLSYLSNDNMSVFAVDKLFVEVLCKHPRFSKFKLIEVFGSNCKIEAETFEKLAKMDGAKVRKLKLTGLGITDSYLEDHAESLAKNYPALILLDLSDNKITQKGLNFILKAFARHIHLITIHVNNDLNPDNAAAIYQSNENIRLLHTLTKKHSDSYPNSSLVRLTPFQQRIRQMNPSSLQNSSSFFKLPLQSTSILFTNRNLTSKDLYELKEAISKNRDGYAGVTQLHLVDNPELIRDESVEDHECLADVISYLPGLISLRLEKIGLKKELSGRLINVISDLKHLNDFELGNLTHKIVKH